MQLLLCDSAGWCGFLKKLLAASPLNITGQCFMAFLQSKHRWGQGQTTGEGSWAFFQGLWGVTILLRGGQASKLIVQYSNITGICSAYFMAVAQAQANQRQGYCVFLMIKGKQTFVQSYMPRKIVLVSEWPLCLHRKVTLASWPRLGELNFSCSLIQSLN